MSPLQNGLCRDGDLDQLISEIEQMIKEMGSVKAWNSFFLYVSHGVKVGTLINLKLRLQKMGWWVLEERSTEGHPFTMLNFQRGPRFLLPSERLILEKALSQGKRRFSLAP